MFCASCLRKTVEAAGPADPWTVGVMIGPAPGRRPERCHGGQKRRMRALRAPGRSEEHWGQANVFIISCTHLISSTTPDQENTAIFPIQRIRVQSMPYRTWPVPRARSAPRGTTAGVDFYIATGRRVSQIDFIEPSNLSLKVVC